MMPEAQLYSRENIAALEWPTSADGEYARRFLLPLLRDGVETYIRNAYRTRLLIAKVGETVLPLTVTDFHPENSYVCSPYSHYVVYGAMEEVERLNNPPLQAIIRMVARPIGWYLRRSQLDHVVFVNNWLLSTNLYPSLTSDTIAALCEALPRWFPDRAIVFRSVDQFGNPQLYETLRGRGYQMVFSRQVWYTDPRTAPRFRDFKRDLRLLQTTRYVMTDAAMLTDAECERLVDLYNQLYITKYSHLNPQFTASFFRLARDHGALTLRLLRHGADIVGVSGCYARQHMMTAPIVGYDTRVPISAGLYRLLSLDIVRCAADQGNTVHFSAGVGQFKKTRGGRAFIEYNAVYGRHLPFWRRLPWRMLQAISSLAIPIIQKRKL